MSRDRALAITTQVEIFRNGTVVHRIEGSGLAHHRASFEAIRSMDQNALRAARATFVKLGKRSKRGMSAVSMSLQAIDALGAQTREEFHEAVRRLPVAVVKSEDFDALGRSGIRTEFSVRGDLKLRLFQVTEDVASPSATPLSESVAPDEALEGAEASNTDSFPNAIVDCEYWSEDEQYLYEGECATQQELDDTMIILVALDTEIWEIDTEMQDEIAIFDGYCDLNWEECEESINAEVASPDSPSAESSVARRCDSQKWFYGGSLAWFVGGLIIVAAVVSAPVAVPALALGSILAGPVAGAAGVAGSAIALHECMVQPT